MASEGNGSGGGSPLVPFRDLVVFVRGGGWGASEKKRDHVPVRVIRGTDFAIVRSRLMERVPHRYEVRSKVASRALQVGDLIVEISGGSAASGQSTGRSLIVDQTMLSLLSPDPVIPASFCRLVRLDSDRVYPLYAYFALQDMYLSGRASMYEHQSTGISNFQFEYFLDSELIRLPPLVEQRAIAHVLGTLDDKIELNRRMNQTLEAMAKAIFQSWFVDFEPVRAKLEGRWHKGESLPGLPAHLYDLFPDRLVDSELGEIPEGWRVSPLDDIATFLNGLAMQKYPATEDDYLPVIRIADLHNGVTGTTVRASTDVPPQYVIEDGDVLFSWSGSLEAVLWSGGHGALNQHLFKVTSDTFPRWLYYEWVLAHLPEFREIAAGKATTMGHIQRHHLSAAQVVVPDMRGLEVGTRAIEPLLELMVRNAACSHTLVALRDTLLPKLISGEIRIKDAEKIVGDVT